MVSELKSRFQKFLNVGPFHLAWPPPLIADEHDCLQWLDKHKPSSVAYISFGSMMPPPPHEQAALAEALDASGFPFLWSSRGNVEEHQLLKGFTERMSSRGKIVSWAPQVLVLGHRSIGVFVTHGGWNSVLVLESIRAGVPIICRPALGDQKLITRIVVSIWGNGVWLEGGAFTNEGAANALELIMSSEKRKEIREKAEAFREPAVKAVAPNGSSSENFKTLVEVVIK